MRCSRCGFEAAQNAFCPNCGANMAQPRLQPVESTARLTPTAPKRSRAPLIAAICVVAAAALAGIIIALCSTIFYHKSVLDDFDDEPSYGYIVEDE